MHDLLHCLCVLHDSKQAIAWDAGCINATSFRSDYHCNASHFASDKELQEELEIGHKHDDAISCNALIENVTF